MVTPSLVTSGEPVIFSRITLRTFGPSLLLAEGLGELVVDEVHPGVGVDADHRGQVGDGHARLVLHDGGDDLPDLVVHQRDAGAVGRRLVDRAESGGSRGGHWFSSFGASRP